MKLSVNGLQANFEVYGKGENVLILHGWGDNIASWRRTADYLAQKNRVFLLDLPGFGNSQKPPNNWNTQNYVEFVNKFLDELEIKKVILIGHSFGGKIACLLASKYPKRVKKMVLVSSQGLEEKSVQVKTKIILYKTLKKVITSIGLSKSVYYKKLLKRFGSKDYKEAGPMRRIMVNVVNDKIENCLEKIRAKTMIVWGDKDRELDVKTSKKFKEKIPNSFIRIVWGAGHFPHLEDYKSFNFLISQFINENL